MVGYSQSNGKAHGRAATTYNALQARMAFLLLLLGCQAGLLFSEGICFSLQRHPQRNLLPPDPVFKNEINDPSTKVFPSFTHGTALPWAASTSLQTQIQEFATSSDHKAEFFAKKIVDIMKESSVKGDWNLVD